MPGSAVASIATADNIELSWGLLKKIMNAQPVHVTNVAIPFEPIQFIQSGAI
jgi:hypothetical protein